MGYQSRKKAFTSNSIFLGDNLGQILAFGNPKSGNYHDSNDIETILTEVSIIIKEVKTIVKDLLLNADAGFGSRKFREILREKEIMANIPKILTMIVLFLMKNCTKNASK